VLQKHGLCQPLVWNKRTGVLCGGHQRLAILDTLVEEKEWGVPVTVVDLDDKQERELNIALNNSDATGSFDFLKLGQMFKDFKIDVDSTGFDVGKLKSIIPDVAVQIPSISAQLEVNKKQWQEEKKANTARQDAAIDRIADRAKDFTPQTTEIAKAEDRYETAIQETDDIFYIPFIFPDMMVAARVKEMMGLPPESRDQDGRVLMQIIQEWAELKRK
jgi:ParB-like chromosome segregation protein Spo0J